MYDFFLVVKQLREETGMGLNQAKEALRLCHYDADVAKEYTRLSGQAVKRYKMLNGEKVPFTTEDYVSLAESIVKKEREGGER